MTLKLFSSLSVNKVTHLRFMPVFSVLFTLFFVLAIEYWLGWQQLLAPWQAVSWLALLWACVLVFVSYILRAVRLYDYFHPHSFIACLRLMLLHNLFNNFLPMRAGEVSFPVLMQRYFQISVAQSTATLLWFRGLDLHSLGALALLALASHGLSALSTTALMLAWLSLPWWVYRWQQTGLQRLYHCLSPRWHPLLDKIQAGLPQQARAFWRAWWWTLLNWTVKLGVFAWVLSLFVSVPSTSALLGAVGGELSSVLPIHGVAGVGTYEAGIVAALLPFGLDTRTATQAAVNLHLFLLGVCLLGGVVALLLKKPLLEHPTNTG